MKLDNTTRKILIAGFEKTLKEYGENMRTYELCLCTDRAKEASPFWESAEELERNLLEFINKILNGVEIEED